MTAPGATPDPGPTQGHPDRPAEPAPDGWGPQSVPSVAVLARLAQEQDVVELRFELRLLKELRREDVRRADAMEAALGRLSHKFTPAPGEERWLSAACRWADTEPCLRRSDHPVHLTPAVVRARLDAEATP
jgi:hypothetical protein